jgi:alkylhydroperoxidase family enzyme
VGPSISRIDPAPPAALSRLQAATRDAVVDGPGTTDAALRRQVAAGQPPVELAALVQKIFDHAYRVTDDDVNALRAHYSEEQLFELMVAAAVGASERRLQAALAALESA